MRRQRLYRYATRCYTARGERDKMLRSQDVVARARLRRARRRHCQPLMPRLMFMQRYFAILRYAATPLMLIYAVTYMTA